MFTFCNNGNILTQQRYEGSTLVDSSGFQKQEKDKELWEGAMYYKYRVEDPRLGRFFSVDPLYAKYPYNSNYAFSENRLIDGVELEGLEQISIHNYAFAPFDDFGGGYHGDGENRRFGDKVNPLAKLSENFRIGSEVQIDLVTSNIIFMQAFGAYSHWIGDADYSAAKFENFNNEKNCLNYHYSGGNAEPFWPLNKMAMEIDVKIEFNFESTGKNTFKINGLVKGDRYPSNESYLKDIKGNKLFFGVSGPDAILSNEGLGPYTELAGSGEERMQEFSFFILFNEDETFKGVSLGDGTWFELKDWNKIFTDLDPKDQNVGTNIKYDEIQLDYDPD